MTNIRRDQLEYGMRVLVNPRDDRTRKNLVEGLVSKILSNANEHPHGILIQLDNGVIGRVKQFVHTDNS